MRGYVFTHFFNIIVILFHLHLYAIYGMLVLYDNLAIVSISVGEIDYGTYGYYWIRR